MFAQLLKMAELFRIYFTDMAIGKIMKKKHITNVHYNFGIVQNY